MSAFSSRFDLNTHERKRGDRNLMTGLVQQGRPSGQCQAVPSCIVEALVTVHGQMWRDVAA